MSTLPIAGILLATVASTNLNLGKGIQKWKVRVLGKGLAALSPEHRRDLTVWVLGVLLTATATPLYSLALKFTDKSSLVSALNGVGLIALVAFAHIVLREHVGWQELSGALLVLLGTAVMGLMNEPIAERQTFVIERFLYCLLGIGAVFGPLAVFSWTTNRLFGFTFGAIPGILIGIAIVLGDMALVEANEDFLGQFSNPYPYIALIVGSCALVMTQLAFWRSNAMVVVPTINAFIILAPVGLEYFTFGTVLNGAQYGSIAAIVAGVILLTATERGKAVVSRRDCCRPGSNPDRS